MPGFTVIPAIDIRNGKCVRLAKGDYDKETVYSNAPVDQAVIWEVGGAAIIHIVDLDGAREGAPVNLQAVKTITDAVSIPCELGGGIRSMEDASEAFAAGVSRIILGTVACRKPLLVKRMLDEFEAERIVVGIAAKNGKAAVALWLESTGVDALELAANFAEMGVERFIYTDIETDGMLSGPNLNAQSELCDRISHCAVIASGGVSSAGDIAALAALNKRNLEGVIVGKSLYDGKTTLQELIAAAL
ncbi:MAG: 1-(5-phosphoribosyl)-5-[(5-phosphoribosylamino)methylideneamino]imidazole-4-carboxamide isomerase [Victivallales bacterium]|nr:1-(5-phosphoribosyl)-5-[(5-phosphoribosylamino)methylideneamino]imidazole-4-carboxamide isomerase [Victivallales bacterium]